MLLLTIVIASNIKLKTKFYISVAPYMNLMTTSYFILIFKLVVTFKYLKSKNGVSFQKVTDSKKVCEFLYRKKLPSLIWILWLKITLVFKGITKIRTKCHVGYHLHAWAREMFHINFSDPVIHDKTPKTSKVPLKFQN